MNSIFFKALICYFWTDLVDPLEVRPAGQVLQVASGVSCIAAQAASWSSTIWVRTCLCDWWGGWVWGAQHTQPPYWAQELAGVFSFLAWLWFGWCHVGTSQEPYQLRGYSKEVQALAWVSLILLVLVCIVMFLLWLHMWLCYFVTFGFVLDCDDIQGNVRPEGEWC